jgi:RHS repeat-associated protein
MYYLINRYYEPKIARFISKDPALDPEDIAQEPKESNPYAYAGNNPIMAVDPDGFWPKHFYWHSGVMTFNTWCMQDGWKSFDSELHVHEIAYKYSGTRVFLTDFYDTRGEPKHFRLLRSVKIVTKKENYFWPLLKKESKPYKWWTIQFFRFK